MLVGDRLSTWLPVLEGCFWAHRHGEKAGGGSQSSTPDPWRAGRAQLEGAEAARRPEARVVQMAGQPEAAQGCAVLGWCLDADASASHILSALGPGDTAVSSLFFCLDVLQFSVLPQPKE